MPYYRCRACGLTSYSAAGHSAAIACPNCLAVLPGDAKLYPTPHAKVHIARTLVARPEAVADARRALSGLAVPQATLSKLALLMSEIVTNSVRHSGLPAGAPVTLDITHEAGHVRLAVRDGGHGFDPSTLGDRDPLTVGGQGLVLVAALSDAWGVECHPDGCTVWCEVVAVEAAAADTECDVTAGYVHELAVQMARPAPPLESLQPLAERLGVDFFQGGFRAFAHLPGLI